MPIRLRITTNHFNYFREKMSNAIEKIITCDEHTTRTRDILRENYFADNRPWVVAYSGGKDSTLVLQLVYELVLSLPKSKQKPIFVISSDTKVEAPIIEQYVESSLISIEQHANQNKLNISTHLVTPSIEQGFWFNLIGKGYPPPNRWFRWCTSKMKIRPVRNVIENIVKKHGSVILLLGTRIAESSNRSRRMKSIEKNRRGLNPHHEIPNALVLSPIAHWSTDEVWEYLFTNNPPPWGGSHTEMLNLYRAANGGECPVIMDSETPTCGGSRFGCWTCTVVKEDKSMQSFIENGEAWMKPLNDYRNWLKEIREHEHRRCKEKRDGREGLGPFKAQTRMEMLSKLLETEKKVSRQLISDKEIIAIQKMWNEDFDIAQSALRITIKANRKVKLC